MIVSTARINYDGHGRLDVTRKSADPWAKAFAPSWRILGPAIAGMRRARGLLDSDRALADEVLADVWSVYVRDYTAEMRRSFKERWADWNRLLVMPEAVLCCYCVDALHCHRTLLARDILPRLGATFVGEVK